MNYEYYDVWNSRWSWDRAARVIIGQGGGGGGGGGAGAVASATRTRARVCVGSGETDDRISATVSERLRLLLLLLLLEAADDRPVLSARRPQAWETPMIRRSHESKPITSRRNGARPRTIDGATPETEVIFNAYFAK